MILWFKKTGKCFLKGTITSLALAEKLAVQNKEEKNPICGSAYKVATWSQSSRYHLSIMILFFVLMFGYVVPFFRISII
jgi:centromeric protein E